MNDSVGIILLQYNNFNHTKNFLESFEEVEYENYDLILVDNKSIDDSLIKLKKYFQKKEINFSLTNYDDRDFKIISGKRNKINIIESNINGGYSYGINAGLKFALSKKYDYYFIINNDTIVSKKILKPLINLSQKNKKNGLISSKIYFHGSDKRIWFNGGSMPDHSLRIRHYDFGVKDDNKKYSKSTFISGCTNFISHEALIDIGLHDENLFFYGDDIDFSIRFRKKGYNLLVANDSIVYHKKEFPEMLNSFQQMNMTRSKRKLINKHFSGIYWITAHLDNIFYDLLKNIYYRKFPLLLAHIKGLLIR